MPVVVAFLLDLLVGDPAFLPHPVVYIGKAIDALEQILRASVARILGLRTAGALLTALIVGGAFAITWLFLSLLARWSPMAAYLAGIWLISTTLAAKSLAKAGKEIYGLLVRGHLPEARRKVGWIVGRDTENLDQAEITRATVETVAENMVDAVVAPLFYAFVGGALGESLGGSVGGAVGGASLAMAYRAVNTLDSMVGYKNEKYLAFGWASARLDDLANFLPARITGGFLVISAWLNGFSGREVIRMILRDARKHSSPNSGYPEAGVAGALGIRLGGMNYYGGRESFRAYMGDAWRPLEAGDILKTSRLMYTVSLLAAITGLLLTLIWR